MEMQFKFKFKLPSCGLQFSFIWKMEEKIEGETENPGFTCSHDFKIYDLSSFEYNWWS
jgi:hypothetical protein